MNLKTLWKRIRTAAREWWRENIVADDPWEAPTTQPAAVDEHSPDPTETATETPADAPEADAGTSAQGSGENATATQSGAIPAQSGAIPAQSGAIPAQSGAIPTQSGAIPAQSAPALDWRFGGFHGEKAAEDPACKISGFKMGSSGCSLKWESRVPSSWKRNEDGLVVCAAFFLSGGRWVGGKFDWIDESRSTRDWKNVKNHYNGWNPDAFFAAKRHAFCVVSADGKRRSPLLED